MLTVQGHQGLLPRQANDNVACPPRVMQGYGDWEASRRAPPVANGADAGEGAAHEQRGQADHAREVRRLLHGVDDLHERKLPAEPALQCSACSGTAAAHAILLVFHRTSTHTLPRLVPIGKAAR